LSYTSARRISRPLEEMRLGAERLARGETMQLAPISDEGLSTEMAALAAALNRMGAEIDRRIRLMVQQRNELEAMFASMADPVVAIDAERRVIRLNQAAAALFNLPAEGVQGKAVEGVLRHAELLALIDRTLADNSRQDRRVSLFAGTEPVLLQTRAVPLRDEQERSMGVLLVLHDLTRLNRLEHIRQDFVANVSHELKTPITAIRGYVETLLDGALEDTDNARRFLDIVLRQAGRLDAIVDDLLTLSRIENRDGHEAITLAPAEVRPVLESAVQTCAVQAAERGIEVRVEGEGGLRAAINPPLLEQAVINLLQNAITYSPPGARVVLRAEAGTSETGEGEVRLRVSDNGPGIGREHLGRLFERFYRCDRARSRDQGGTGLGLSIVKHIAQAHHGAVAVDSTPGQGSTFTISLPAA
jgi:two-component system phosphate regulon sensor histidine kinase PhoR